MMLFTAFLILGAWGSLFDMIDTSMLRGNLAEMVEGLFSDCDSIADCAGSFRERIAEYDFETDELVIRMQHVDSRMMCTQVSSALCERFSDDEDHCHLSTTWVDPVCLMYVDHVSESAGVFFMILQAITSDSDVDYAETVQMVHADPFRGTDAPPAESSSDYWHAVGECQVVDGCVHSTNYPENHGNGESCTVTALMDMSITLSDPFAVESGYDFLTVGDTGVAAAPMCPESIAAGATVTWSSDGSVTSAGWELCGSEQDAPTDAPPTTSMTPTQPAGDEIPGETPTMDPEMCMNTGTQTWGLAAIDDLDENAEYFTEVTAGHNVHVYVLDTGFFWGWEASEFPGRVDPGISFIPGEEVNDLQGHGTHCAGTIGSLSYGVAKETTIVPVKVLSNSGSGSSSGVNNGMQWVDEDRIAKGLEPWQVVVSMSLGGSFSQSQNDVANALVDKGITVVVAAGNDGTDACRFSPASAERVITVMASDSNNNMASFSNYGQCADIIAPGVDVMSTISNMQTAAWSGTSMACPHVTGIVATMQSRCGGFTPEQVWNNMLNEYTDGDWGLYDRIGSIRSGFGGTRNLFVQNTCNSGCTAAPAPPETTGGPTTTTESPWDRLLRRIRDRFGEEAEVGAEPEAKVAEEVPEVQEEVAAPKKSPKKSWTNYKYAIIGSGLLVSFCLGMVTQRAVGKPRGDVYAQLVDDEI